MAWWDRRKQWLSRSGVEAPPLVHCCAAGGALQLPLGAASAKQVAAGVQKGVGDRIQAHHALIAPRRLSCRGRAWCLVLALLGSCMRLLKHPAAAGRRASRRAGRQAGRKMRHKHRLLEASAAFAVLCAQLEPLGFYLT
jgi:hypothetical protein